MFSGSIVALITPFENGQVDENALKRLVDWHIDQGTSAIVPVGTTGESPTLSHAEHKRVVEITIDKAAGRIPVIAGAGSNNTIEAIEFTQHAKDAGADASLHVAGYYNRPNQDGLYAHFKAVHDAVDLPLLIYNIPPRAIVDILPETMARLAALPGIIGVKDATADLARICRERMLIKDVTTSFCYLSGEDPTALAYRVNGGDGCISVTANVAPKLCAEMHAACSRGDYGSAFEIHERLMPLHAALFTEPSPAGVKFAASALGLCAPDARLPIVPVTEPTQTLINDALRYAGLMN